MTEQHTRPNRVRLPFIECWFKKRLSSRTNFAGRLYEWDAKEIPSRWQVPNGKLLAVNLLGFLSTGYRVPRTASTGSSRLSQCFVKFAAQLMSTSIEIGGYGVVLALQQMILIGNIEGGQHCQAQ